MQQSGLSFGGRFKGEKFTATANAAPTGVVMASYHHKVNEKVSVATELECNVFTKQSLVTVGYEFDLRQANFKGQVDSGGVIAAVLEQKMAPGVSFLLTGTIDQTKANAANFGFGLLLGGAQ